MNQITLIKLQRRCHCAWQWSTWRPPPIPRTIVIKRGGAKVNTDLHKNVSAGRTESHRGNEGKIHSRGSEIRQRWRFTSFPLSCRGLWVTSSWCFKCSLVACSASVFPLLHIWTASRAKVKQKKTKKLQECAKAWGHSNGDIYCNCTVMLSLCLCNTPYCSVLSSSYWLMSVKMLPFDLCQIEEWRRLVGGTNIPAFWPPSPPQYQTVSVVATLASLRRRSVHCDGAHVQPPKKPLILLSDKTMTASQRNATCVYGAVYGSEIKVTFILLRALSLLLFSQLSEESSFKKKNTWNEFF